VLMMKIKCDHFLQIFADHFFVVLLIAFDVF